MVNVQHGWWFPEDPGPEYGVWKSNANVLTNNGPPYDPAMGTYQLWLLVLSQALYWGVGTYLVLAHQVKFTGDVGYSSMFSASVFGLFGIFFAGGQGSAFISDWIGREKTITLASILSVGALVSLLLVKDTSQPVLLYLYATCFSSRFNVASFSIPGYAIPYILSSSLGLMGLLSVLVFVSARSHSK